MFQKMSPLTVCLKLETIASHETVISTSKLMGFASKDVKPAGYFCNKIGYIVLHKPLDQLTLCSCLSFVVDGGGISKPSQSTQPLFTMLLLMLRPLLHGAIRAGLLRDSRMAILCLADRFFHVILGASTAAYNPPSCMDEDQQEDAVARFNWFVCTEVFGVESPKKSDDHAGRM